MLPIFDKLIPLPSRYPDPSYVEVIYITSDEYRFKVGFFRQWNKVWYRHEKDCS